MLTLAVPSMKRRPSDGARPSQRAASTRRIWPLENTIAWSSAARRRPMTRSERAPAGSGRKDFAALAALVVAVVPFEQVGIKLGGVAEPSECAGASRTLKGTGHG